MCKLLVIYPMMTVLLLLSNITLILTRQQWVPTKGGLLRGLTGSIEIRHIGN